MKDPAIAGREYLRRAIECHGRDDYPSLFPYLKKSIRCLLPTQEYEQIARAYNLFAVHAQRFGCYDISYHYFMMAESFASKVPGSFTGAQVEANMGDLLADLGEYRRACSYISKAVSVFRRHKEHPTFTLNILLSTINLGVFRLYAGDIAGAKKTLPAIERGLQKQDAYMEFIACWYLFLQTHLYLLTGDGRRMQECLDGILSRVAGTPLLAQFADNIGNLCRTFLRHGAVKEAGRLLSAMEENDDVIPTTAVRFRLADVRIEYYGATGQQKKKNECYAERNRLAVLYRAEQMRFYRDSVELIQMTQELRAEQAKARAKNRKLQQEAETDALTRIPNRHALNRAMEEACDRALAAGKRFGIGVVDVDFFKQYNDKYGHRSGDNCLVEVANTLRKIAAEHRLFVARYGGDEFVLLYENMTDDEILRVEEQIHRESAVPVSHGFYATVPSEETRLWDFFAKADAKLYKIKSERR